VHERMMVIVDALKIRLRELRLRDGHKPETIANYLGCAVRTVQAYERGEREFPIDMIPLIARLYNVSADYLFGLSDEMQPQAKEFEQATGLSEKSVALLQSMKNDGLAESLNLLLEMNDFKRIVRWFKTARIINKHCTDSDKVTEIDDEAYQGMIEDTDGKAMENAWFPGESQIEMCLLRATNTLEQMFTTIMEEDKNNGKCNEEN